MSIILNSPINTIMTEKTKKSVSFNNEVDIHEIEPENSQHEVSPLTVSELEHNYYVDLINIFLIYYKTKFNKSGNEHMFAGIDVNDETSTNRSTEMFYELLCDYKKKEKTDKKFVDVYEPDKIDDEKFTDIYALLIDGVITNVSPSLLSLMINLAENKKGFVNINWKIIKIKGSE